MLWKIWEILENCLEILSDMRNNSTNVQQILPRNVYLQLQTFTREVLKPFRENVKRWSTFLDLRSWLTIESWIREDGFNSVANNISLYCYFEITFSWFNHNKSEEKLQALCFLNDSIFCFSECWKKPI